MKKPLLFITLCAIVLDTKAQNTFPSFGNIGIGTLYPKWSLDILGANGSADNRNFMVTYPAGGQIEYF